MADAPSPRVERVTAKTLLDRKREGRRISMCTAYDAGQAALVDGAGIDVILVGDSAANVIHGDDTTIPATLDEMVLHTRWASRGRKRALLVGDMPFMSYQPGVRDALLAAGRFLKEGRADAVKLEGGRAVAPTVTALVEAGIPVMGHLGLTPQSVNVFGGYRVQGRTALQARAILEDAEALERAGAFSLVLECVPAPVAAAITARLGIPTIGIGAGPRVDGQVLVFHDLLGFGRGDHRQPRFVKRYAELGAAALEGLRSFRDEVERGAFPGPDHVYAMLDGELDRLDLGPESGAAGGAGGGASAAPAGGRAPA